MLKFYAIFIPLFVFPTVCVCTDKDRYILANGYIYLSGTGGVIDALKFDPAGKGKYGLNIVKSIYAGEIPEGISRETGHWKIKDKQLELENVRFYTNPKKTAIDKWNKSVQLQAGHTLGQSINVETDGFVKVGICCPTWYTKESGMSLRLKRGGPEGEIIASNKFKEVPDNSWQYLTFPPQPKGKYYIEMAEPIGTIGWWSNDSDIYATGEAYLDGKEKENEDRTFEAICCDVLTGNLNISLSKNRLECKISVSQLRSRLPLKWLLCG